MSSHKVPFAQIVCAAAARDRFGDPETIFPFQWEHLSTQTVQSLTSAFGGRIDQILGTDGVDLTRKDALHADCKVWKLRHQTAGLTCHMVLNPEETEILQLLWDRD